MSKISYLLRKTSKKATEAAIYVKHTHQGSPYVKASGVSVHPDYFDAKTGKVSNKLPAAPELNSAIEGVRKTMEKAARNLTGKGVEPLKPAMESEYSRIEFQALVDSATQAEKLKRQRQQGQEGEAWMKSELDMMKDELAELQRQVEEKKWEIENFELALDIHEGKLLSKYVKDYCTARAATLAPNSLRLFVNVADLITKFNPTWRIDDVNIETLRAFQGFLLGQGKKSLTVADIITKTKSVFYYYARTLRLDIADVKAFTLDFKKKKNANVVYLTRAELSDLIALHIEKPTERVVRDQFVLMCLTGLRFSDSRVTRDNIVNGQIRVATEKTDTDVFIPIAPHVQDIREAHNYNFKYVPASNFNKYIKAICQRIPSIAETKELVRTHRGGKVTKEYKTKDTLITCHVGRKTFINLALERGVNPVAIADIVGHEGTNLIMETYGSKEAGREQLVNIWD